MAYYSENKKIKETVKNKTVAVATYEVGAEIIVKALNCYFSGMFSNNQAIEMMHNNTAKALQQIADFVEENEYDSQSIIKYLREIQEEMEAQAKVVSLRDELKFSKPEYNNET